MEKFVSNAAALTIAAAAILGAVVILRRQDAAAPDAFAWAEDAAYTPDTPDTMPDQLPGVLDTIAVQAAAVGDSIASAAGFGTVTDASTADRNTRAFLEMIAYAEGTARGPNNGYSVLFGWPDPSRVTYDLSGHPRQRFTFTNSRNETLTTTAAGRYQFLSRTWDALQKQLNLPDFGPASQDAAAIELIRQRGALKDVQAGRIAAAIAKIAPIWASMPGAGYAQPERKINNLLASYSAAGGNLEA
jgi:muramidase (phage lysozyme)